MKRVLLLSLVIAGCFIATTGNAQVYFHARVSFAPPLPRIFCPPPPPVMVYNNYPDYYQPRECERPVVIVRHRGYENDRYYENDRRRNHRDYYDHDRRYDRNHRWRE